MGQNVLYNRCIETNERNTEMRKMSKKKAKHLLWAFDKDRNARAVLKCAVDENNTREERDRAWEDYLFYSKWRDDELLKAIGMTLEEFHNHAFS